MSEQNNDDKRKPNNLKAKIAGGLLVAGLAIGSIANSGKDNDKGSVKPNDTISTEVTNDSIAPTETTISEEARIAELTQSAIDAQDKIKKDIEVGNQIAVLAGGKAHVVFKDGAIFVIDNPLLTGNKDQVGYGQNDADRPVGVWAKEINDVADINLFDAEGKPIVGGIRSPKNLVNPAISVIWEFVNPQPTSNGGSWLVSETHPDDSGNGILPNGTKVGALVQLITKN
ncbi:MAG: hypothetical protein WCJ86_03970 [Candidatus Saccharibacteria bacterium]